MKGNRTPGRSGQKLKLIRSLNPQVFPELVADILHFVEGHTDIKIMDGGGDGRRDIHSRNAGGEKHVTQCKFHSGSRSVGSRQVDEIGHALLKFGAKRGLFATTGKISPQAKRELLDDFPGYTIDFLDGAAVVDAVLGSGILRTSWYDGTKITDLDHGVAVPFFLRRPDGTPLKLGPREFSLGPIRVEIAADCRPREEFEPYRPYRHHFLQPPLFYDVDCYAATFYGPGAHRDLSIHRRNLIVKLQEEIEATTWLIRYGLGYLTRSDGEALEPLVRSSPSKETFVVESGHDPVEERAYLLPDARWMFAKGIRVAEMDWARWYDPASDICLDIELTSPVPASELHIHTITRQAREHWFYRSVFCVLSSAHAASIALPAPTFDYEWIGGARFMGWLHPSFTANFLTLYASPENVEAEVGPAEEKLASIKRGLQEHGAEIIEPPRAYHMLASIEDEEPIAEPEEFGHRGVVLFFDWDLVPSPVWISERRLHFDCVWQAPASARTELDNIASAIPASWGGLSVCVEKFSARHEPNCYLLVRVIVEGGETHHTSKVLDDFLPRIQKFYAEVESRITGAGIPAKRATADFWREEIGVIFDSVG